MYQLIIILSPAIINYCDRFHSSFNCLTAQKILELKIKVNMFFKPTKGGYKKLTSYTGIKGSYKFVRPDSKNIKYFWNHDPKTI